MLVIYGKKWNGSVAAAMYTGPVKAVLQNAWPRQKKHLMLEDNDPTGFKSGLGETAKKAARISAFVIPKRSPDLSVLGMRSGSLSLVGCVLKSTSSLRPNARREMHT